MNIEEMRAAIKSHSTPRMEPFPTPEWPDLDGSIYVRGMTANEQDEHEVFLANNVGDENANGDAVLKIGTTRVTARVVAKGLVTKDNERLYSDSVEDIDELGSSPHGGLVSRAYKRIKHLSGVSPDAAEDLEKN